MAAISFLLAPLLEGTPFLFKQASGEISVGTPWAGDVCWTSQMFCHRPEYPAYAAGVMLVIAIVAGLLRGISWFDQFETPGVLNANR